MKERSMVIQQHPSYAVYFGNGLLTSFLLVKQCAQQNRRLALLSDEKLTATLAKNIQSFLKEGGVEVEIFSVPSGEIHKTRETKQMLEDLLLEKKWGRDSCFIALGGGMVTDLVGYLASTYCRGIPWIAIPTTLLGMVDASIGGKTGVNTPHGKNLIGTFYPPTAVFIDIAVLKTLPQEEWRNGVVEMIKHACIADKKLFQELQGATKNLFEDDAQLLHLIEQSCSIKKNIVEKDEREMGVREILNFGHTIGHALESLEHYRISHGEAVAMGMVLESQLAQRLGFLKEQDALAIVELLEAYQIPLRRPVLEQNENFLKQLQLDKKSKKGVPHYVLLREIGKVHCEQNKYSFSI